MQVHRTIRRLVKLTSHSICFILITSIFYNFSGKSLAASTFDINNPDPLLENVVQPLFLPLVKRSPPSLQPMAFQGTPRVNIPHFDGNVSFSQSAIFWFGRVNSTSNYADVRVAYNDQELFVNLAIFDRYLWYDPAAIQKNLMTWDAVNLYLRVGGNEGKTLDSQSFRFTSQLSWFEARQKYQVAANGRSSAWTSAAIPFTTESGWRGNAPNDNSSDDRGWTLTYHIPFSSLGLSGPPPQGTVWGMGVTLFDRDELSVTTVSSESWPPVMSADRPASWGQLAFGLPVYVAPTVKDPKTITLRNKLNGISVQDGVVGGGTVCATGTGFWSEWGEKSTPGSEKNADINIQNQMDVSDWPCFSKYYLTIPLDSLPSGKAVLSAKLILHQFGNSGGGEWGESPPSLIQVFTASVDWKETTLTWNNAPLALENTSMAWVDWLPNFPGWPGVERDWDVSRAAAEAYAAQQPLRLILYSADSAYHSGKYFVASDTPDWNEKARPTLELTLGTP